jgi:hypothetical protein
MRRRKGEWDIVMWVFVFGMIICGAIFRFMPDQWLEGLFHLDITEAVYKPPPSHVHRYPF